MEPVIVLRPPPPPPHHPPCRLPPGGGRVNIYRNAQYWRWYTPTSTALRRNWTLAQISHFSTTSTKYDMQSCLISGNYVYLPILNVCYVKRVLSQYIFCWLYILWRCGCGAGRESKTGVGMSCGVQVSCIPQLAADSALCPPPPTL